MTEDELLDSVGEKLSKLRVISKGKWEFLEVKLRNIISCAEVADQNTKMLKGEYSSLLGTQFDESLKKLKKQRTLLDKLMEIELSKTDRDTQFTADQKTTRKTLDTVVSNLEEEYEAYNTRFKTPAKGKIIFNREAEANSYIAYAIIGCLIEFDAKKKLKKDQLYNIAQPIIAFIESKEIVDPSLTHNVDTNTTYKRYKTESKRIRSQRKGGFEDPFSGPVYASFPLLHAFCESL